MTTDEIIIRDRTIVYFDTPSGTLSACIRNGKLRISANDYVAIETTASNVVLISNQRRRLGDDTAQTN